MTATSVTRRLFSLIDEDRSGCIELQEAASLLVGLGLTAQEVADAFKTADTNESGQVDFAEFHKAAEHCLSTELFQELIELSEMFGRADINGDGYLDREETFTLLAELGIRVMPGQEADSMFASMDVDSTGHLSFAEFVRSFRAFVSRKPRSRSKDQADSRRWRRPAFVEGVVRFVSGSLPRRGSRGGGGLEIGVQDGVPDAVAQFKAALSKKHSDIVSDASERMVMEEQSQIRSFWFVLAATAMLQSLLSFTIDKFTFVIGELRSHFTTGRTADLLVVIIFNVMLVVAARVIVRSHPDAQGSGFPEVKAMLFGKLMPKFLTMRVLATKALALAMVVGAGMPIGKEGPNVHMAACFSATLGKQFYSAQETSRQRVYVQRLLLAACAVGVGTTFSSPVGGVIFALEFMLPQILDAISFCGCFVAAAVGSLCYAMLRAFTSGGTSLLPMVSTNVRLGEGLSLKYPFFVILLNSLLGLLCGLLSGLWIKMHAQVSARLKKWRTKTPPAPSRPLSTPLLTKEDHARSLYERFSSQQVADFEWRDIVQVATITVLNTLVAAAIPILGGKPEPVLISMLFDKQLLTSDAMGLSLVGGAFGTLVLCLVAKWFTTAFALSMPTPTGAVAPTMIIGGFLGRVFIMALPVAWCDMLLAHPDGGPVTDDERGAFMARFAMVGACAFASGVTRTFAMSITIFEAIALPGVDLSLSISTLLSILVANKLSLPFFDLNLAGRGLLGIPAITSSQRRLRPAFSFMRRIVPGHCVRVEMTVRDVRALLEKTNEEYLPIVHASKDRSPHNEAGQSPSAQATLAGFSGEVHLAGSASRVALHRVLETVDPESNQPDKVIDFLDPSLRSCSAGDGHLVQCCPLQVSADTTMRDVYIIMKATASQVIFVTADGFVVGCIYFSELLEGKRASEGLV